MNRRTLILVENLPVPFDRRVWQEAMALKRNGWTVSVICPIGRGHTARYEQIDGIHIYRHPLPVDASGLWGFLLEYGAALFWEFVLSVRVLRRHGFDVIQACNPPDLLFLIGWFYKVFLGKRFLFDHHDISPELYEAKFNKRGTMHRILGVLERLTFRTADASIATNATFKQIAVDRGGMDPDKVWIVKSYPDLNRFYRVPNDPTLKHGRAHLLGYVGIMGNQDGVEFLVRAMAHIVHDLGRTDIGCAIIGDGPELEPLQKLSATLGVANYVEFTGYLTGERLLTYLSTIDVGVIPDPPNVYNDKISMNKVFEYMSLGIPFVLFDLAESRNAAGNAALVADGADGVALGNAAVALVDDPARRATMAEYGRSRAATDFRWDNEVRSLVEAYESLVADDAPVPAPRAKATSEVES